jgi:hypothetical protein
MFRPANEEMELVKIFDMSSMETLILRYKEWEKLWWTIAQRWRNHHRGRHYVLRRVVILMMILELVCVENVLDSYAWRDD